MNERSVLPFLITNKIPLHEFWTSHRHSDHRSGKEILRTAYKEISGGALKDSLSLSIKDNIGCTPSGDTAFNRGDAHLGAAKISIQNAHGGRYNNGFLDLNATSLAFRLEYSGFRFCFQEDLYSQHADEGHCYFGEDAIKVNVLQSSHQWHGSINPEYIRETNADLIIVSAGEQIWGASSFTQGGLNEVDFLKANALILWNAQ
ncbi:hypothetical protein NBRC116583_34480 [Arenicella sp. 4NH20-0111]|uniref:hypothetical protein n=1 Tax=Arenicella sp. 4NH20-0111 TaxID=3127648 RepID=UPI00310495C5